MFIFPLFPFFLRCFVFAFLICHVTLHLPWHLLLWLVTNIYAEKKGYYACKQKLQYKVLPQRVKSFDPAA